MTEQEALQKACPFRQCTEENHGSFTMQFALVQVDVMVDSWGEHGATKVARKKWVPGTELLQDCRCIASQCMAWGGAGCNLLK